MKNLFIILTLLFSVCVYADNYTKSTDARATGSVDKIDSDFDSLDNDNDNYISQEEADDDNVWGHFAAIDSNQDNRLSENEFTSYVRNNPSMVEEGEVEEAE